MTAKQLISSTRKLLANRAVKQSIIVAVLLLTVLAFVHFFVQHPAYIHDLGKTNPWWVIAVIALNVPMIGLLVLIYGTLQRMCSTRLGIKENFLLTSYSSIINFFGPLQSGPGVRAVYLKTRHNVRLRDYTL